MRPYILYNFLFLVLLNTAALQSQGQNNKPVYDINDPRNPDCPCHKLQAQAEQEYKQKQQQTSQSAAITSSSTSSYSGSSSKTNGFKKFQRKIKKKISRVYYRNKAGGRRILYPVKTGTLLVCG